MILFRSILLLILLVGVSSKFFEAPVPEKDSKEDDAIVNKRETINLTFEDADDVEMSVAKRDVKDVEIEVDEPMILNDEVLSNENFDGEDNQEYEEGSDEE
uniref:Secreted protein n=1 Tax=Strongyloides stercoralis TaxID=6248 RepID=A0A0K0E237_STRER